MSADDVFTGGFPSNDDGLIDEVDSDLTRWEYLTRNFDHEGFFAERASAHPHLPVALTYTGRLDARTAMSASTYHPMQTTGGPVPVVAPSRIVALPTHHISARIYIDTSNPEALVLPAQAIRYKIPGSDQSTYSMLTPQCLQVGRHSQLHATGPLQCVNKETSAILWRQEHATNTDNRCLVEDTYDIEPIPLHDEVAARPMQSSASLYDSLHSHRGFLLSSSPHPTSTFDHSMTSAAMSPSNTENPSSSAVGSNLDPPKRSAMCKPLSGYNYFYRVERDNIILGMKNADDPLPPAVDDFSQSKQEMLLHQRWFIDPTRQKRQHRKNHGKIAFSELAKVIAHRWKKLPETGRSFYRQVAHADLAEYERHLANDL